MIQAVIVAVTFCTWNTTRWSALFKSQFVATANQAFSAHTHTQTQVIIMRSHKNYWLLIGLVIVPEQQRSLSKTAAATSLSETLPQQTKCNGNCVQLRDSLVVSLTRFVLKISQQCARPGLQPKKRLSEIPRGNSCICSAGKKCFSLR